MKELAAVVCLLVAAAAPAAHHSLSSTYDSRKQLTITGTVREFQFVNPHPWIGVDVTDNGSVQRWRLELDNRWELENVGMDADTFKPGDLIVASGSAGRNGAPALYVRQLDRRSDGLRYEQVGPSPKLRFDAR
jgi:hypothetical protein